MRNECQTQQLVFFSFLGRPKKNEALIEDLADWKRVNDSGMNPNKKDESLSLLWSSYPSFDELLRSDVLCDTREKTTHLFNIN